ncbi:hypothetical protein [Fictibacillus nanhaiensis]|uniref:hypothetical protein n=1 Tax=Fictibacillus nanhaiensis TaxID=742169 RepID=UPI003C2ABE0A
MEQYKISKEMIIKGGQCEGCLGFGMKKGHRSWKCSKCGHTSKKAHIKALRDYCLLYHHSINNQQARDFLLVNSTSIASKLLVSMNLPYTGTFKDRKYDLQILLNEEN